MSRDSPFGVPCPRSTRDRHEAQGDILLGIVDSGVLDKVLVNMVEDPVHRVAGLVFIPLSLKRIYN